MRQHKIPRLNGTQATLLGFLAVILLGSGLLDSARTVSVPLVNGQTVSVLPDSGRTDSAPMVSIPPVVQPQFTRRRKRSIPR